MRFYRPLLFVLFSCFVCSFSVQATGSVPLKETFPWADVLASGGIVAIIAVVIALTRYVRQQQRNHVQLMVYMYGSVLDGRLRNLIINLQDSVEFLCVNVDKNELDSFSLDGFWRLHDEKLQADLFELAEKSTLASKGKKKLERGFDYLHQAIRLMNRLPVKTVDVVWLLPQEDRQALQQLLIESIDSFEGVRREIVF